MPGSYPYGDGSLNYNTKYAYSNNTSDWQWNQYTYSQFNPYLPVAVTHTGTEVTPAKPAVLEEKELAVVTWLKGRISEITDMAWAPA